MSNTKHTPGKWFTDVPDPAFVNYEVRTSDTIICTMGIDMSPEEEAANARLISAAPDMLQALLVLRSYFEGNGQIPNALAPAIAAIAKATAQ